MRLPANEIHICSWENRGEPDARLKVLSAYVGRRLHHSDIEHETLGKEACLKAIGSGLHVERRTYFVHEKHGAG